MSEHKQDFLKKLLSCLTDHPSSNVDISIIFKDGSKINVFQNDQKLNLLCIDDDADHLYDDFDDKEGYNDE